MIILEVHFSALNFDREIVIFSQFGVLKSFELRMAWKHQNIQFTLWMSCSGSWVRLTVTWSQAALRFRLHFVVISALPTLMTVDMAFCLECSRAGIDQGTTMAVGKPQEGAQEVSKSKRHQCLPGASEEEWAAKCPSRQCNRMIWRWNDFFIGCLSVGEKSISDFVLM